MFYLIPFYRGFFYFVTILNKKYFLYVLKCNNFETWKK